MCLKKLFTLEKFKNYACDDDNFKQRCMYEENYDFIFRYCVTLTCSAVDQSWFGFMVYDLGFGFKI